MDITELKEELLQGKLRKTYVFTGNELALQDVYIDKIREISKLKTVRIDSLKQIYNTIGAKTLIKVEPKIYIIRNDEQYFKEEKVWQKLIEGNHQKDNIIIFLYSGVDNRSKFCKTHESILTEFNFIGESLLSNRVQAITNWPLQYCKDLVRMCGCNYGRIKNELYKLNILAKVNNITLNQAYLEAKRQNMIHEEIGDIIFDFTNAIVERNISKAYKLYKQIVQTDEGPVKLISILYNGFRNVLIVQSTRLPDRTEQILGLSSGQIYMTAQKCDRYTLFELVEIIKLLQNIDRGIKTGEMDANFVIEYLMAEIF